MGCSYQHQKASAKGSAHSAFYATNEFRVTNQNSYTTTTSGYVTTKRGSTTASNSRRHWTRKREYRNVYYNPPYLQISPIKPLRYLTEPTITTTIRCGKCPSTCVWRNGGNEQFLVCYCSWWLFRSTRRLTAAIHRKHMNICLIHNFCQNFTIFIIHFNFPCLC